jgi:hypothetical protein
MASTTVTETFPKEFGIYDLNEFLSAHSLIEDADLVFGDDSVVMESPTSSITYRYADKSILTAPEKGVNMPDAEVNITITDDLISQIRKAGGALGHPVVSITATEGDDNLCFEVRDPNNSSANTFRIKTNDYIGNAVFDFQFLIANLKLIPGDYNVAVSSKLISHWERINNNPVEYWIALEKNSTFGNE